MATEEDAARLSEISFLWLLHLCDSLCLFFHETPRGKVSPSFACHPAVTRYLMTPFCSFSCVVKPTTRHTPFFGLKQITWIICRPCCTTPGSDAIGQILPCVYSYLWPTNQLPRTRFRVCRAKVLIKGEMQLWEQHVPVTARILSKNLTCTERCICCSVRDEAR